jgi:polyhydroxybutyrate depolymerase
VPGAVAPPGDHDRSLQHGELTRTYILHVPPAYDGASRLPVVLNFHGFGSSARNQAAYSRLPRKGDEAGFIVVTPDGAGTPRRWNNARFAGEADDIGFVRALVAALKAELCVDGNRIYAAGISNGSALSQRLACELPDVIAGVAAVAALVYPARCASAAPVPVPLIAFHGTDDRCVPFEGGRTTCGRGNLPVPAVEDAARDWARHNGCSLDRTSTRVSEHVRAIAYSECRAEASVVLYVVEGGGHTWPGSLDVARLGQTTTEIDATDLLWEFFEGQSAFR